MTAMLEPLDQSIAEMMEIYHLIQTIERDPEAVMTKLARVMQWYKTPIGKSAIEEDVYTNFIIEASDRLKAFLESIDPSVRIEPRLTRYHNTVRIYVGRDCLLTLDVKYQTFRDSREHIERYWHEQMQKVDCRRMRDTITGLESFLNDPWRGVSPLHKLILWLPSQWFGQRAKWEKALAVAKADLEAAEAQLAHIQTELNNYRDRLRQLQAPYEEWSQRLKAWGYSESR